MKRIALLLAALAVTLASTAQVHSALANGRWWKLTVDGTGMYALTVADLPALRGAEVSHIGIYGGSGAILDTYNGNVPTNGLQAIPIEVVDNNSNGIFDETDRILFFGEGVDTWRFSTQSRTWEFAHHAYATQNHYFVGIDVESPLHIATAPSAVTQSSSTSIATYTAVAAHDLDLVNIMQTGQKWMGERMAIGTATRQVSLQLPALSNGVATLRYGLATVGSGIGNFSVSGPGYSASPAVSSNEVYRTFSGQLITSGGNVNINFVYQPTISASVGYLDFVELNATAPMVWQGSTLLMRTYQTETTSFQLADASADLEVWEVYSPNEARRMHTVDINSGVVGWTDSIMRPALYVAFTPNTCLSPSAIASLSNQDLHGSAAADLVIVSHPAYISQANRIALAHELFDTLETLVVDATLIYNEYSSGKTDPMAIRTFLRHMREAHPERPPRFAILLGKATYDHRNIEGNNHTTVVTYQTPYSFDDDGASYASDDMMGFLDNTETGSRTESLDICIGRLPVKTQAEADRMADKIEAYLTRRDLATYRGDWRNTVVLLADDADPSKPYDTSFVNSSESTARDLTALYPSLNINRLYADAFVQQNGAIGSSYPELNNALLQQLNNGCLLLNYVGHGSTNYIGTERYLQVSDIDNLGNYDRLPLVMASTCSYGRFDLPDITSGAEVLMLARGGAIGVISASRPISHNHTFDNMVLKYALDGTRTIGEALMQAKNSAHVSLSIGLVGDPALRLSVPENKVVVTAINHKPVEEGVADTATVLTQVVVEGEIQDPQGQRITDFDGTLYPIVYDRPTRTHTLANDNPGTEVAFTQQKNTLYKGSHPVQEGHFEYSFIVPRDVAYRYDYGKLSHYAQSADQHATGAYQNLLFGGIADSTFSANCRPQITLYIGDTNFRSGGLADASPTLLAYLSDEVGINAVGSGIGHDITAMLDNNPNSLVVLNDLYQPDLDDSRRGTLRYSMSNLSPGRHTLTLKAWNIYNLSGSQTISFVIPEATDASFASVSCSPNPATTVARFSLETSVPSDITHAEFNIYSAQGQTMLSATPQVQPGCYVVGPVLWDVRGAAPGVYLGRFTITTSDGEVHHYTTKCIVR